MKRKLFRASVRRLAFCTAFAVSSVTANLAVAKDQAGPATSGHADSGAEKSSIDAENLYDADFDEHVDLRLFGVAFSTLDAKLMTDVALQLREAESILGRKHKMISADQMLEFAAKMAAEGKDAVTIDRLMRVAKASGNTARAEVLEQMKGLAANSRDLRNDAMFSAMDVQRGALAAFANLTLQIRAAELSGNKETLESLKKAIEKLESLREPQRNRLYGLVDDAVNLLGDSGGDKTSDLLRALNGASRDFYPGAPAPQAGTTIANQQSGQERTAAIIVDPNIGQPNPGGSNQISYATGGMRYMPSPSGAIVQSHGRLGSILFEPGDVITSVGGIPVGYGQTVDGGINAGYLTGNRTVVVRDRNSGRVLTLYF
ncbi:hypothetical protein Pla52o_15720 [Novipirellula galeiformis]|uniref:Uncharacterized protein n=1 Tax=Novipirellula galeiformis TaxID=2528004 RepID=A0A5C6CP73_9BACT|nr:hypothetical protein [Novipirellula galeiformis]TWU25274.1 hypothetical protein Pla52o_15720 [Novipirellula galeiformis]